MTEVKKGDTLRYTGKYVDLATIPAHLRPTKPFEYGPGKVWGFRNQRGRRFVTVRLEDGTFADWPVDEVEKIADE